MTYDEFLADSRFDVSNVIYRFKNNKNGKVYIGQTTKSVRKRVIQHMTKSRPWVKVRKTYFSNALNKYGFEGFTFDIIERCKDQQELDDRERYWIAYYKSNDKKYGYNIDSGGTSRKRRKPLTEEHKQKLLLANLGRKKSNQEKSRISEAVKSRFSNPEYKEKYKQICLKANHPNKKPVYQYDLNGNFIKKWECVADVNTILYGSRRARNLSRNIMLNINKKQLGFTKNNSIWSFISPTERSAYQLA